MYICVCDLTITGSDSGLAPTRWQAIIWSNAGILLIGPLGIKLNDILIEILTFAFKKMHLKMSSGKWQPFCLGLNVLRYHWLLKLCLLEHKNKNILYVQNHGYWWPCITKASAAMVLIYFFQSIFRTLVKHWISNYTHDKLWDVITHSCSQWSLGMKNIHSTSFVAYNYLSMLD